MFSHWLMGREREKKKGGELTRGQRAQNITSHPPLPLLSRSVTSPIQTAPVGSNLQPRRLSNTYLLFLTGCFFFCFFFKLKEKVQGFSQHQLKNPSPPKPSMQSQKKKEQKNVSFKSAKSRPDGVCARVPCACSVPPAWQEQTTELCFQERGTSGKVCSQAVLQD